MIDLMKTTRNTLPFLWRLVVRVGGASRRVVPSPVVLQGGKMDVRQLRKCLESVLRGGVQVVIVDLSRARTVNCAQIATLLEASRLANQLGARLVLQNPTDQVRAVFRLFRCQRLLEAKG